jgi:peptidylprolyl isomerase
MNFLCLLFLLSPLVKGPFLCAEAPAAVAVKEEAKTNEAQEQDILKLSEAFGHLIGKNIDTLGLKFDIDRIVKGLKDSSQGKESPMSEMECVQAISVAQEGVFKKQATENLKKAEEFLSKNGKAEGVTSLEEGKLQYKIDHTGTGEEVQPHFSPLIRYTGKYLDDSVFGSSKEDELISLDETIPGFSKGLIGMKEGEKRTLFVHPDLGYGTSGYLPPNSLLKFEVELVKANAPQAQETDTLTTSSPQKAGKANAEIATPTEGAEILR